MKVNIALLTVTDTRTFDNDKSGAILVEKIKASNHNLLDRKICKDNKDEIVVILKDWLQNEKLDVIITTGGTGLTGRDITPEALNEIADKHIPGFGEVFRNISLKTVGTSAIQSRACAILSNGNVVKENNLTNNRHEIIWEDPYPKPSYLFALVAGKLNCVKDNFITKSNKKVKINIYVEYGDEKYVQHAISSLKKSMRWDEDKYNLEYDLSLFNIVAVRHFNMGAMENKSLNIFNSKLILANSETTTDEELERIEGVIAHEYFHNWTGNRVTCRDWFQLSLKEGLTVF